MCTICQAFTPYMDKDNCDYDGLSSSETGVVLATVNEGGSDAPGNITTPYTLAVGDTFNGELTFLGDRDWIAINVTEGQTYEIDLFGSGGSALTDTYLRLYDASGNFLGYNDDVRDFNDPGHNGGTDFFSTLSYTATYTGTIYVSAAAWSDAETGTYSVTVNNGTPLTEYTLDQIAGQLTDDYWTNDGANPRRFDTSLLTNGNQIEVDITALTAAGQQLARWAFEAWTAVSGLQFVEVSDPNAHIVFDDNASGAFNTSSTYFSGGEWFISQSNVNVSTAWLTSNGTTIDSYSFQTYMHEIGHALGLGHAGDYNSFAAYTFDASYRNDSWQQTVMSYFDPSANYNVVGDFAYTATMMMADIIAIQNLYGTAFSTNSGNTVYGFNSNVSGYLGDLFGQITGEDAANPAIYSGSDVMYTLFDTGGTDTLDMSGSSSDNFLNMVAETYSNLSGLVGNFGIARGVVLENAIFGSGDDTVEGNSVGNDIQGGDGMDSLSGSQGADTLSGDAGEDTLVGGSGNDSLVGGTERDHLLGGNNADRLRGGLGRDTLEGGNGDDRLEGGKGRDRLEGGDGEDRLIGGNNNDNLFGQAGNDRLEGGTGNDRLTGGKNADTFVFEDGFGNDTITDFAATNNSEDIDLSAVTAITDYADLLANHIDDSSGTVIIDDGAGNTITLQGITSISQLDAGDFLF